MQCSELLNVLFQNQFQLRYIAGDLSRVQTDVPDSIDVTMEKVATLISELPKEKSPGPDGIQKTD